MNERLPARMETRSTCPYCGVGCGVLIEHDGRVITGVRGDPSHPANRGRLCTKGTTLHLSAGADGRVLEPEIRVRRGAQRRAATWEDALEHCAKRFAATIASHGPDSVGFYISGQLLTEDYYVFNKLAKGLVGSNNIDTNSRLCMSSAVAGYKQTLGADAPPACYDDIDEADLLFIAGSNTAYAHPILYRRIEEARRRRGQALRIVVVDPRRTDTAREADLHLQILPGSDIALFNAMLHVLIWEGLLDDGFIARSTAGFDGLKDAVRDFTPANAGQLCGVAAEDIVKAARWFGASPRVLSLYCQGLNQSSHGTHNNAALINLHLATGKIGKPGCGPLSLTGQPNAMGGREVGGMANLLSAHRDLANPAHRAEVAALWGVPSVPERPGYTAVEMFEAARKGTIKALWIACTNPAQSMPDALAVREALSACEFVVVQEAFRDTDTVPFADVLLPASTWGEKHGTVTNSERRITRVNAAVPSPGDARHDWDIAADFARRLGIHMDRAAEARRMFGWDGPEAIWNEHRATTRGRDLDITGLSYAVLDARGPQQWPMPAGASSGTGRLYTDGRFATADGLARFVVTGHRPVAERPDARFPLALNTGRLRDQWHGMSRTGRVARLFSHVEEPRLAMTRGDLARRGLADGDIARVTSRRGEFLVRVEACEDLRAGQVFMPMHWGDRFMRGAGVNTLTSPAVDPYSAQPELKACAIEVACADLPHRIVAMRRPGAAAVGALRAALQTLLERFDYATLTLAGRDDPLVVFTAFSRTPIQRNLQDTLDRLLELDQPAQVMRYVDVTRGVEKAARFDGDGVSGVCLTGETAAAEWLKSMMAGGASMEAVRPWVLAPVARPPRGSLDRGRIVCNCFDVADSEITADAEAGMNVDAIQARRKCGTSCGSCLPEVRRLVAASHATRDAKTGAQ